MPHALGLFAGGLDSRLAVALLRRRGVGVSCVHFDTGFVKQARREIVRKETARTDDAAPQVVDVSAEYLRDVVLEPRFGYGGGMNPCLDCRIFMLRRASALARQSGAAVLFTGEVVGQRAMDQSRAALIRIEREAGVEGRVLRPLSGRLLPRTRFELNNGFEDDSWARLHGRSRRGQRELARELGVSFEPVPSGGCCWLADRSFAARLRDQLAHDPGGSAGRESVELLKRGRHFRVSWNLKLALGRDEEESAWLDRQAGDRRRCQVASGRGALGILEGTAGGEDLRAAGALAARYSRQRDEAAVEVAVWTGAKRELLEVAPAPPERVEAWRIR